MTQGHDGPIQQFAARCKTAGGECYFKVRCTSGCNTLVKDEISLEEIVRAVAGEEAVTRSNQVFQPDGVQSMKQSSYQKSKKEKFVNKSDEKCTFCSREGHTENVGRQKLTCTYCQKQALTAGRRREMTIRGRGRESTRSQTYQSERNRSNTSIQ